MHRPNQAFTIIELLIAITVIGILAATAIPSYQKIRRDGRDTERVAVMENLKKALELYKQKNGHYPDVCGSVSGLTNFFDLSCSTPIPMKGDEPDEYDFINSLYPAFFSKANWSPPAAGSFITGCQYIIPETSSGPGCASPDTLKEIQRYYLYCGVEGKNTGADNDGGASLSLYEIFGPKMWVCPLENICGDSVINATDGEVCDDGPYNGLCNRCNSFCTGAMPSCGSGTFGPKW